MTFYQKDTIIKNVFKKYTNGGEKMKRIVVEMEDDFHKCVKIKAVSNNKSIKGYVKELIEKDLQKEKEQTR